MHAKTVKTVYLHAIMQ